MQRIRIFLLFHTLTVDLLLPSFHLPRFFIILVRGLSRVLGRFHLLHQVLDGKGSLVDDGAEDAAADAAEQSATAETEEEEEEEGEGLEKKPLKDLRF